MNRNVAVVGCGYWGRNLVRNFAELGALRTVCDANTEALAYIAARYPDVKTETDYQRVIDDRDIDGIVIAAPAALHYPLAKQALLSGKHVFVEKPLAYCSSEAEELVSLSDQQHRILMVGHLMLYHPAVKILKQHMDSGTLGTIYYLYSTRVNLGQVRSDEGALFRLVPHDVALLDYLLNGVPEVVSAEATAYVQPKLEDVVFATLRFPNNVLAHVHASWLDPHKTRQLTVVGSKGMAVFDDMDPLHKLKIYDKGVAVDYDAISPLPGALPLRSGDVLIPQIELMEPLLLECRHFVECMAAGSTPLSDGKQGLEVVRTLEQIKAKAGR